MNQKPRKEALLMAKAEAAFQQAAKNVIKQAKQTNTPVIIWQGGCIKEVLSTKFDMEKAAVEIRESTT